MKLKHNLRNGVKSAFENKKKASGTLLISSTFFIFLALSTAINYSIQMLSSGLQYWIPAIQFTVRGFYLNGGWTEVILNTIYAILVGIISTNTYIQFKNTGLNVGNLSGIAPGVLVAGCAGCGVGLLSLIGLTSIITILPFQGLSLKIVGILLITYFIAKIGNPKTCTIPSSS